MANQNATLTVILGFFAIETEWHIVTSSGEFHCDGHHQGNALISRAKQKIELQLSSLDRA